MNQIKKFLQDESGATSVEYSLLVVLIALVIFSAVTTLGSTIGGVFNDAASKISVP